MDDLDATAVARLHSAGQRYTDNRRELVHLLRASEAPLTIPEILERRRDLAQSSVYRNLTVLEQSGLVHRLVSGDEWARFELAHDLTEHHHHLICSMCGIVRDFTVPPRLERSIEQTMAKVADDTRFTIKEHRLDLVGVCQSCGG